MTRPGPRRSGGRRAAAKAAQRRAQLQRSAEKLQRARDALEAELWALRRLVDMIDRAIEIARYVLDPKSRAALPCFAPGTPVLTPLGPVPIEQLAAGDVVLAHDLLSERTVAARVAQVHVNRAEHFFRIRTARGIIQATGAHPFRRRDGGHWTAARDLRPGMELTDIGGDGVAVEQVSVRGGVASATYNLSVDGCATFFAGPGVLVHNDGIDLELGGDVTIYIGESSDPRFADCAYIGQTNQSLRGGSDSREYQHHAEAEEALRELRPNDPQRRFWEFKRSMRLRELIVRLPPRVADYLEQRNLDIERKIRGSDKVFARREQVSPKNMGKLAAEVAADERVKGRYCPR